MNKLESFVNAVNVRQGGKATEFAALGYSPEIMQEAVSLGLVGEIEYILPTMDWRIKSFYLPKGTIINTKNLTHMD